MPLKISLVTQQGNHTFHTQQHQSNIKWRQIPSDSEEEADGKKSRLLSTRQSLNREFDECETSLASALAALECTRLIT